MLMQTKSEEVYLAPEIEVNEVILEQGIALSQLENPDEEFGEW